MVTTIPVIPHIDRMLYTPIFSGFPCPTLFFAKKIILGILFVCISIIPQNSTAQTSNTTSQNSDIGEIGIIDTDDYNLDEYYISDTILDKLSQDEVRTLLNAMYAHYGYTFTTEKYAQFFSSKPWYSSRGTSMSDCESMFNDYERKNKETITAYESRKGWR